MTLIEDVQTEVQVVSAKLDAVATLVQTLKDQVAAGSPASVEQLQAVLDSLKGVEAKEDAIVPPSAA